MKKTGKKLLGKLLVFVVIGMSVAFMRGQTENVIASNIPENARVIQVESAADLAEAISLANDDSASSDSIYPVYAELLADIEITSDSALPSLEKGELIVELNGYSISAGLNGESVFTSVTDTSTDTSSLTIQDSSEMKQGTIENTGTLGGIISKNGGSLTITEGNLKADSFCIGVTNCETNISGGDFTANADIGNAMKVSGSSTVTVSGGTFTSNYITCSVEGGNNSVTIEDGTFTAEENGTYGYSYAWYVWGKETSLTVSDGTFNLNAKTGSSLVIGSQLTNENITLSGGIYNGRIAREAFSWKEGDYTVYYGDVSRGIIADGYVLTDNTFVSNGEPYYAFTQDKVEIVPGAILKFNTQRSGLESVETDEEKEKMDFYTMQPISVGTDGTIYSNSTENTNPVIEQSATANSYEFAGWEKNGTIYTDVNDYIKSIGYLQFDDYVYGMWDAKVSTTDGMQIALEKQGVIRNVTLDCDLELESGLNVQSQEIYSNYQRILDLGGYSISFSGQTEAITLSGNWKIKSGNIETTDSTCLNVAGRVVLENLNCKAQNANYAVIFVEDNSTGNNEIGEILSGTYETGVENGSAIGIQKLEVAETIVARDELANILKGKYVSSTLATLDSDTMMIKSDGERLIVSDDPITYVQEGTEVSLGDITYGESGTPSEQELSNKDYIGDIVITGISVDNPVFEVKQTGTQTKLLGGSETTYGYSVGVAGTPAADTYEGTISITYTKMDKTTGTFTQPVSVTIKQKQLTIGEPSLTKTKVYDGTTAAEVTAGVLSGVITDDDGAVDDVAVEATAVYDNANVGTGKKVTVKYTLTGADKANYIAPVDANYTDGVITAKQLTIEEPTLTKTKTYDGTTAAEVKAGELKEVVTGDAVAVEATAEYASADAGTGKTIEVKYTLTGASKDNYIAPVDASYTDGVITARQLTIEEPTLTKTKAYDKTTAADVKAGALKEAVTGDDVAAEATAEYDSAGVGTGKTIAVQYTLTGADKDNYVVPVDASYTDGVITAKQLTIEEPTLTKTKTYDKTTLAEVKAGALSGVLEGDAVAAEATAEYASADAGTGKTITVKYTLTGVDKDNYVAPVDANYTDGVIDKANGMAAVTMESYHVGETAPEPKAESKTNAGAAVTFYYKEKSAADTAYTTVVPAGEGSYTVKAVFAETVNYNAAENTADFAVTYIDTPQEPYALVGTKGNNGWYTSGVTIYPAAGYLISDKQDGTYKNSYLVESTQNPVLYLKDGNGAVTRAVQVEALQIDAKKPTISGITDGETYYDDNLKVVVSDDNLESITLNGIEFNVQDGRAEIFLQPSLLKYVLKATDKAGNQVECTITVEETWVKQGIISNGIKNLVTKKAYKLGTGKWKVSGDNTVYQGGINFYATSEGFYDFQKQ